MPDNAVIETVDQNYADPVARLPRGLRKAANFVKGISAVPPLASITPARI